MRKVEQFIICMPKCFCSSTPIIVLGCFLDIRPLSQLQQTVAMLGVHTENNWNAQRRLYMNNNNQDTNCCIFISQLLGPGVLIEAELTQQDSEPANDPRYQCFPQRCDSLAGWWTVSPVAAGKDDAAISARNYNYSHLGCFALHWQLLLWAELVLFLPKNQLISIEIFFIMHFWLRPLLSSVSPLNQHRRCLWVMVDIKPITQKCPIRQQI